MKRILILTILLMSSLAWAGSTTVVVGQGQGGGGVSWGDAPPSKNVWYSCSPFGTGDLKTGSPTITIETGGKATLSVAQTGNIGQGDRVTYNTSSVAYIAKVVDSSHFYLVTATGGTPGNVSGQTVNSIAHEYASLSAAEAGFTDSSHINNSSLVTADVIVNLVCYYDHDDYTADTTQVLFWGATTDATRYVNIYAPIGGEQSINNNQHAGKWSDTNAYRLVVSDGYAFGVYSYVKLVATGLQCKNSRATGGNTVQLQSNTNVYIDKFIAVTTAGGYANIPVYTFSGGTCWLTNSVVVGASTSTSNNWGVTQGSSDAMYIYNCTISNNQTGVVRTSGTLTVTNCAVFNNEDDFWGSSTTIDYCASDDGDGDHAVNISPGATEATDWAAAFTDYANGDFSVKDTDSALYGAGIVQTGVTTDIIGTSRGKVGNACDIGAFEYVSE